MSTKVSIIVTAHNYADFLPKALDSALAQTFGDLEVVVVNDGSTDNTEAVLAAYEGDPRVNVVTLDGVGLAAASNRGVEASNGEYIVRLDADDWFDDNLVLVLATFLDNNPDIGLVFCDYYSVDVSGELIQTVRRAKTNDEVKLLDRPCLAAGAMYRRSCFDAIGGYDEALRYQEDYDFWLKFIEKFEVRNIRLPLMYYRQHQASMSRNQDGRMRARREVKSRFAAEHRGTAPQRIMVVIPARADVFEGQKFPLLPLGARSLLERCIDTVSNIERVERVIVSTEDAEIAEHARAAGAEVPFLRGQETITPSVTFGTALEEMLQHLRATDVNIPELIAIVYPHSPFIRCEHITEAINSLLIYDTDSVVAVVEDLSFHWKIGENGLAPVGYQERVVRQDKDLVFKEAGSIYVVRSENLADGPENLLGSSIGHIELSPNEAFRINGSWEYGVVQSVMDTAVADQNPRKEVG